MNATATETQQTQTPSSPIKRKSKFNLSCAKCCHVSICLVFRTFQQGHKQVFPEGTEPAFQVEDLANICSQFFPETIIAVNKDAARETEAEAVQSQTPPS